MANECMKDKLFYFAYAFAVGSLGFWAPLVLVRMAVGSDWGVILTLLPLTFLLPVFACFVLEAFTERWTRTRLALASGMITGIWATASFWITLTNTLNPGEGFHAAGAWSYVGLMTATFPFSTIMVTTYDGSLFAVLFTTAALFVFSLNRWSFQPLLDRCFLFGHR